MPETWSECVGQVVDGQFPLLEHLGGSDHSVVFLTKRGKDKAEKAAIKFVQVHAADADAQISRWKLAAQLSHANLIKVFECGRGNLAGMDLLYVVTEYASENLAEFLPERALSPAETRDMLEPFLDALSYLHGKGLLHGAIRPTNVLAIDDQLKLSGDSIRRIGERQLGNAKADAYTAPESTAGESTEAADVWALGVTLVETLTQRVPEHSAGKPEEVPVADTLPQPFLDIARHCLQAKPKQRWKVAEVSACLNAKAAPPQPLPASTQTIAAGATPAATTPAPTAAKAPPESKPASAPAKAAAAINPLSVPLSTVKPLSGAKKITLENQVIAGSKPAARAYYLMVAVVLALVVGAILAIPRFRSHPAEADSASRTPDQSAVQPSATPAKAPPSVPPKSQPKVEQKQPAPPANAPAQPSALQPEQAPAQDSLQRTMEKQAVKKAASSPSTATASLRVPPDTAPVAPPFVPDREASIKAGTVTPGEVLNQILPEVSERSRSTIHGTVRTVIKVHVDSSGSVDNAEIASAPSRFFANAALEAARQWDFAPAKVDGHAVPSEWLLHFEFTPSGTKVTPLPTKP
jgi:TonB family protein